MKRFHKPENALRRAKELVGVGKKKSAMDLLHRQFTTPKFRQWQQAYEDLMIKFFDLCVDLRETRKLKDGLHHYRNSAQQAAPSSLETVIKHLIRTAERRARKARAAAENDDPTALSAVEDLDEGDAPETIMLGTVTNEDASARQAKSKVVPWTRFLWDIYRAVLENLKLSTKLERVYHSTARKAFKFCIEFQRKTELRRLASILRHHLINVTKNSAALGWTMETLELHMNTRFAQLDTATQLELWHEAFRTVEDIHTLIERTQKQPRAQLMAEYFEKLTQIFWVADNFLFHAYAWFSFYTLSVSQNRALSQADRQLMASRVVLAALCIPLHEASGAQADMEDDRNARLAELLQFPSTPSRAALMSDIRTKGVLANADPVAARLFNKLEDDFHPLRVVKSVVPDLVSLGGFSEMRAYVPALEQLLLHRLVAELSEVYRTVRISYFRKLISGLYLGPREGQTPYGKGFLAEMREDGVFVFKLPFGEMYTNEVFGLPSPADVYLRAEALLVRAAKARHLRVRVDHANQVLRLGHDAIDNGQMSQHLTRLATGLQSLCATMSPVDEETREQARQARFQAARASLKDSHTVVAERQALIERRKEEYERQQKNKRREEDARIKAAREAARRKEALEAQRVREKRKEAKEKRDAQQARRQQAIAQLTSMGEDVSRFATDPNEDPIAALKELQDKKDKEAEEAEAKARGHAKQLDYLTRATREAEWKRLQTRRRELLEAERKAHAEATATALKEARDTHAKNMAIKARLANLRPFVDAFRQKLVDSTLEERQAERAKLQEQLEQRVLARLHRARSKKRAHEERVRQEAEEAEERARAEEREAHRRAEEEAARARAEAERLQRIEEAEARRAAEAERRGAFRRNSRSPSPRRRSRSPPRRRSRSPPRRRSRSPPSFRGGARSGGAGGSYVPPSRRGGDAGGSYVPPSRRGDRGTRDRDERRPRFGGRSEDRDDRYGGRPARDERPRFGARRDDGDRPRFVGRDSRDSDSRPARRW